MDIKGFSPHIFWSYNKSADLETGIIIRQVIAYGEIKDMLLLVERLGKKRILSAMDKWKDREQNEKRINFLKKVILD